MYRINTILSLILFLFIACVRGRNKPSELDETPTITVQKRGAKIAKGPCTPNNPELKEPKEGDTCIEVEDKSKASDTTRKEGDLYIFKDKEWKFTGLNIMGASGSDGKSVDIHFGKVEPDDKEPAQDTDNVLTDEVNIGDLYIYEEDWKIYKKKKHDGGYRWQLKGDIRGERGSKIFTGSSAPNNDLADSKDDDIYIQDNGDTYTKTNKIWVKGANIKGADGKDGVYGERGSRIYHGTDDPNNADPRPVGDPKIIGDTYIKTATGDMWRWGGTAWAGSGNLKGKGGERGSRIYHGDQGANAAAGAPNNIPERAPGDEVIGDLYINNRTGQMWRWEIAPGAGGAAAWGRKQSIKGERGPGFYHDTHDNPDTNLGTADRIIGDTYINTDTGDMWKWDGATWAGSGNFKVSEPQDFLKVRN